MLCVVSLMGRDWLWLVLAALAAAAALLYLSYRPNSLSKSGRIWAFALKWAGVALISLCLLDPHWVHLRARPGANYFGVVADTSASLSVRDRGSQTSRAALLQSALTSSSVRWPGVLEKDFQVRRYGIDSQLRELAGFEGLKAEGESSSLLTGLRELGERFRGRPLAGILLFTDGNATDLALGLKSIAGLPPIYPVLLGSDQPPLDVAVKAVSVRETEFEDAPVTVQAEVMAVGYGGREIVAQLWEIGGNATGKAEKMIEQLTQVAGASEAPLAFRFQFKPRQNGLSFYRVKALSKQAVGSSSPETGSDEATLVNNERIVPVYRSSENYRVLYVSGRPNWEYKFLRRALKEDEQVTMAALMRVAKREPKFDFKGRAGERSNPLFRGFGGVEDETQRYDQPVIIRLDTRDENELRGGFPKTAEELFPYHAVIVDDLESEFFTQEQMNLLVRFVSERGGGFVMLGGQESFREGKYSRTPLAGLLPVYLEESSGAPGDAGVPSTGEEYKWELSREGWLQPWMRLREMEPGERDRIEGMPPFRVLNTVRGLKPGASVMAHVKSNGRLLPALAVQRYGHGRAASMMIGDLWRWGMRDEQSRQDMEKVWRQLVRWLVADTLKQVDVSVVPKPGDASRSVDLMVRARKPDFEAMEDAHVSITVQRVGSSEVETAAVTTDASAEETGSYQGNFWSAKPGAFSAKTTVTDGLGKAVGVAEVGWVSEPAADEFASVRPNVGLLQDLAKATGGRMVKLDELEAFAPTLATRSSPIQESSSYPIWHRSIWLLLAIACFGIEWGIRRRGGLA